jgi:hypothetical protein
VVTRTDDESSILEAIAKAGEPVEMFELIHAVTPAPEKYDGRTRETKAFHARTIELIGVFIGLCEQGVLIETREADGQNPSLFALAEDADPAR